MKILITLFCLLFSTVNNCKNENLNISYINNGNKNTKTIQSSKINSGLKTIFENSNEILRLAINDEYVNDYKNNNDLLEIEFNEEIEINSPVLNNTKINKILLPLSGDLRGDESKNTATAIYYSENILIGNPVRVINGYEALKYIYQVYKNE
ncbi:MAG TPA: hypothetical protein PLG90_09630 [Ignavibacteria bacterium]|nr:hypothetical protein [Ignavibacteria bacterium]